MPDFGDKKLLNDEMEKLKARLFRLESEISSGDLAESGFVSGDNQIRQAMKLLTQLSDFACLVDGDGRILAVNPPLAMAIVPMQLLSANPSLEGLFRDDDAAELIGLLLHDNVPIEALLNSNDESSHIVNWRASRIGDSYLCIGREVTHQVRQRRLLEEKADRFLKDKNSLRRAQRRQRLDSLMVMAGGLANDLNNILTGMMGNLGMARLIVDEDSPLVEHLGDIENSAHRARDLAYELLAYSGHGSLEKTSVNISDFLESQETAIVLLVPPPHELRLDLSPSMPSVLADTRQLSLALTHLVSNAVESLGEKPGTVGLSSGYWHINMRQAHVDALNEPIAPGAYCFIEVSDDGCGIDASLRTRIFEPFFSGFEGRGLGLAAIWGVVKAHGGALQIDSESGSGTRVRILLPVDESRVEIEPESLPRYSLAELARTLEGVCVLLVDDEPLVRTASGGILAEAGIRLLLAENARQALDIINYAGDEIDLIIVDLNMPGMNGATLVRRIRSAFPGMPIVLSSGYSRTEALRTLPDLASSIHFLPKPYALDHFLSEVAVALNRDPL